jgi:hypothetical protein
MSFEQILLQKSAIEERGAGAVRDGGSAAFALASNDSRSQP